MDDCNVISVGSSVQEVEKSCSDLHLSDSAEESGPLSDKSAMSGSLPGKHQSVFQPEKAVMETSEKVSQTEDRSLSGASSEPTVPLQGGAGGPGGANLMSKMMVMMMSGGGKPMTPDTPVMPSVPDMMSMLKGSAMPLPDMVMSKGGLPCMMGKGMKAGPMEMATIFDCIIDMSLARADSDESEEDEDVAVAELPCQYCCRLFSSQMSLKTHILVAHEQEDDSVLNLTQLTINNNRSGPKDGSPRSRKVSRDDEVFASGMSVTTSGQTGGLEQIPAGADLAAAVRGVKRGRTESKDLETAETGGASGMGHRAEDHPQTYSQLERGASPDMLETVASSGPRKGQSGQRSQCTPMEAISQSKSKKSKKRIIQKSYSGVGDSNEYSSMLKPTVPLRCSQEDVDDKEITAEASTINPGKDRSAADKTSSKRGKPTQGLQAGAAAGPEEQAGESPTSLRRSLRSRKSKY
ncbi:hypothetical protein ACOMHN_015569 [Nucella lapillus]